MGRLKIQVNYLGNFSTEADKQKYHSLLATKPSMGIQTKYARIYTPDSYCSVQVGYTLPVAKYLRCALTSPRNPFKKQLEHFLSLALDLDRPMRPIP